MFIRSVNRIVVMEIISSFVCIQTRQHPKFVVKEMESMYMEELRSSINLLKSNLESLPVSKGGTDSKYSLQKLKRYNRY